MTKGHTRGVSGFQFRDLHPKVFLGTASDRYAGWLGQIYTEERYKSRISARTKALGGTSFKEQVLPVESVAEYFQHFSILELDFTFYRLLFDRDSRPTENYRVLRTYQRHLGGDDHLMLKVPQVIFAQKLWRGGTFIENPEYLNHEMFIRQFYEPAVDLLGKAIKGFIFEQEYQTKRDRTSPEAFAAALDKFFGEIPEDDRYHIEVRTESLLSRPYFTVLEKHGIGQVLSHWTWLPPLRKQFDLSGNAFLNSGRKSIIRLMTPLRMRYEEAYAQAFPFDKLVDGMMSPRMVEDTVAITAAGIDQAVDMNVVINNRAGGNAPLIAQKILEKFLEMFSKGDGTSSR